MSFISFLMGVPDQSSVNSTSQSGSLMQMVITFGLIFLVMYFLIFRPQKKKEQETKRMIDSLKKGDKVVTIGGIHGTISSTKEKTVIVKVDDNSKIEFNRTAIATVIPEKTAEEKSAPVEEKKAEKKGLFSFGKKTEEKKETASDSAKETKEESK